MFLYFYFGCDSVKSWWVCIIIACYKVLVGFTSFVSCFELFVDLTELLGFVVSLFGVVVCFDFICLLWWDGLFM